MTKQPSGRRLGPDVTFGYALQSSGDLLPDPDGSFTPGIRCGTCENQIRSCPRPRPSGSVVRDWMWGTLGIEHFEAGTRWSLVNCSVDLTASGMQPGGEKIPRRAEILRVQVEYLLDGGATGSASVRDPFGGDDDPSLGGNILWSTWDSRGIKLVQSSLGGKMPSWGATAEWESPTKTTFSASVMYVTYRLPL